MNPSPENAITMVFQLAVTVILGAMLPWVIRVSRELGEIRIAVKNAVDASQREADGMVEIGRRVSQLELAFARNWRDQSPPHHDRREPMFGQGDGA